MTVYVNSFDLNEALTQTIYLFFGDYLPDWQGVVVLGLLVTFLFYSLYMTRYLRLKLVTTKPALLPLLPEGEKTFLSAFHRVSQRFPPIVIGVVLMALYVLCVDPTNFGALPRNIVVFCKTPANILFITIAFPLWFVIFSTFAWVYFGSIRGFLVLGKTSLRLKSFQEDKYLGTKPFGSLSLSFAFTYFSGLGILGLPSLLLLPNEASLMFTGLLFVLVLLGLVFFFFSLNAIHRIMLKEKNRELDVIRHQFVNAVQTPSSIASVASEASLSEMKEALNQLTRVITVDVTKDEVEAIPTWPIETPSQLVAIIIAILTGILTRMLYDVLRPSG